MITFILECLGFVSVWLSSMGMTWVEQPLQKMILVTVLMTFLNLLRILFPIFFLTILAWINEILCTLDLIVARRPHRQTHAWWIQVARDVHRNSKRTLRAYYIKLYRSIKQLHLGTDWRVIVRNAKCSLSPTVQRILWATVWTLVPRIKKTRLSVTVHWKWCTLS